MSHQIGYFFEKHLSFFQTFVEVPGSKTKVILVMGLSVRINPFHQKKMLPSF
jgi:hypothetical protein